MNYQQCTRCIMDNKSDDTITFDKNGHCNYCTDALSKKDKIYFPNAEGAKRLEKLLTRIKKENKDNKYDCVMGISGGLDSSYLAYLGSVKWGLRILAIHVDDGFDTDISKRNIDRISKLPNFDLKIVKPDRKQYNELTKAYMRAGVPNLAVPQDNILFANVYKFAKANNIKIFMSGGNFALESILQRGNTYNVYDLKNLKYINKKFGKDKIDKLEILSQIKKDIDYHLMLIEAPFLLNLIDYNRDRALKELNEYFGFEYYGSKHLENDLTKFIQQYWFYKKFNVDKRTSHLSSMIISNQMSREEAQKLYTLPLYNEVDMQKTIDNILQKLKMDKEEFEYIMAQPPRQHTDYPTSIYPLFSKHFIKLLRFFSKKRLDNIRL